MPRLPAKIRQRKSTASGDTLSWELEEGLLFGETFIGPVAGLKTIGDWRRSWDRWRSVIMPKVIRHRPGTRPMAAFVCGEIPERELLKPLPQDYFARYIEVRHPGGIVSRHYLGLSVEYIEPQAAYLKRIGVIDKDEYARHVAWIRTPNPNCDSCAIDTYPLENPLQG